MINVAYVIDTISSPYAGTERQLLHTIGRIDRSRVQPHVVCLRESDWWASTRLEAPSAIIRFRSFRSLDYFRGRREFRTFCRENRIDIVQTFFHDANLIGTLWARAAGTPVVIASRRNLGAGYWHNRAEIAVLRWLRGKTDHYVANSTAAAEEAIEVEKLNRAQVSVIPNGIDPDDYRRPDATAIAETRRRWGFQPHHIVIGTVANLRPIKNLPFFIRCAATLAQEYEQARFVIIGEGDQREKLQRMIDELGLRDRVSLPGRSKTVGADLYGFDIAVLCSKGESLSNSLMEYMATGRPPVASAVGGNSELINSPALGHLYRPDDAEDFLAGVRKYIVNEQLRNDIGRAGGEAIRQRFRWEVTLERLTGLYEQLAREKSGSLSESRRVEG